MPNWVYNSLTIEGNPDEVQKVKSQLNQPFTYVHDSWDIPSQRMMKKDTSYSNPVFAFWNIVKPTDLEAYHGTRDYTKSMEDAMKFEGNDWYDFNVRNWGTKWDVAVSDEDKYPDTELIYDEPNGDNHVLVYKFNTAWSRPLSALTKLSAQYPTLLFTLEYEEETGWGGECEFLRGEYIEGTEYENKCRDCDAMDTLEYCEDNDCGEICSACHWLGEADLEAVKECQTHSVYLGTNVPDYRKDKI